MMAETNQDGAPDVQPDAGEGSTAAEKYEVTKSEYEALLNDRASLGSLKREFKDLKKSLDEKPKETPKETTPDSSSLLKKAFLRTAGITDQEEQELALSTAKKWGVEVDQLVDDDDFKAKLEKHRTAKTNATASSNIKGSGNSASHAKDTSAYWKAKGQPPTPDDVPDRKARQKIIREMVSSAGNKGTKFYNE